MSEVHRYKVVRMLSEAGNRISYDPHGPDVVMAEAYDQLKAENEALRRDKDRLDALEANGWDIRNSSSPIADTGDYSNAIEIVGRWMDKPHERVIGENYSENLRAALDQAMSADAYPPARPEYDFCEGALRNGNRARRRAEALGIDYDAAMAKGRAQ
ncbi:hypothetical protein [Pseudomonas faucium]|uniref:hypothetical protein n=1 Tax=Pseudomonas faucium TaxID=2740518 RepID=UPI001F1C4971|nr:hypothetical protein [Pseudomonas faucium]